MSLNEALKKAIIEDLKKVNLLMLNYYAHQNHKILIFLYEHRIIDDSSIECALEEAVFRQAREDYETMTKEGRPYTIWADHLHMPECLAYALGRGEFSREEIKKIPFDHGQNAETFFQRYGKKNLPSILREELLNPRPLPKFEGDYDPHPVCECGY
ncbi:MAG: hypothetical protein N3D84_00265 [Candidatus Woesearchaeota archaeon]|nr:hypothetical protein [Candidatus Woesearchaeota archaeon]